MFHRGLCIAAVCITSAAAEAIGGADCSAYGMTGFNPSGTPWCVKVGVLDKEHFSTKHEYYTHTLPQRIFEAAVHSVDNVSIQYVQTTLDYEEGIKAVNTGEYDVFLADTWILEERTGLVDFTSPYKVESMSLLYEIPVSADHATIFSFADPFSLSLWLIILATFPGFAIVLALVELGHESSAKPLDDGRIASRSDLFGTFKRALFHCLNSPYGTQEALPQTSPGRFVQWQISFFYTIVVTSYTANLAAFLTTGSVTPTVSTAELLKSPIMVANHSDSHRFFTAYALAKGITVDVVDVTVAQATPEVLKSGTITDAEGLVVRSIGEAEHETATVVRQHCKDAAGNTVDATVASAIVEIEVDSALIFAQDSPVTSLKRVVDQTIIDLKEKGVLAKWNKAGLPFDTCASTSNGLDKMTFKQMSGTFYVSFGSFFLLMLWGAIRFIVSIVNGEPILAKDEDEEEKDEAPTKSKNPLNRSTGQK